MLYQEQPAGRVETRPRHPKGVRYENEAPLSPEQQKLAAKSLKLIGVAARRWPALHAAVGGADDATSSAHEALCVAARRWRPEGGVAFSTYAVLYIRSFWQTEAGRRKREAAPLGGGERPDPAAPEEAQPFALSAPERAEIRRAIRSLSPRQRQVVRLLLKGLSAAEAAAKLGISPENAHSCKSLAIKRLRSMLEGGRCHARFR